VLTPIAFVSEHSETLVELDVTYRDLAAASGVPHYARTPTVDAGAAFIAGLAELVRAAQNFERPVCSMSGGRICPDRFSGCSTAAGDG
jgi:ferrochelatase